MKIPVKTITSVSLIVLLAGSAFGQIGIGTTSPNSMLDVRGSMSLNYKAVSSSATLGINDNAIIFTGASASVITLPSAVGIVGRVYSVKNASTTFPTPLVTLSTTSSQTIDGISSWLLDENNESVILISNGANWNITANSLPTGSGTNWTQGGNSVGSLKSMGTISNYSMPFITNNTERMRISNTGNVAVGTTVFDGSNPEKLLVDAGASASSYNVISGKGTINNYLQLNIQNRSSGTSASSDLVATADNGSESVNYVDLGINSSAYSSGSFTITGINDGYLYSTGNDFAIGNSSSGKSLKFFTNGSLSANERMRIDGSGNVGIGTVSPTNKLTVVSASNPLFLGGVQSGTNTDSILIISNGVVKRLNPSSANTWTLTGNSGTLPANNFLGTIDAQPLLIKTSNAQIARFDATSAAFGPGATTANSTNSFAIGAAATVGYNKIAAIAIGSGAAINADSAISIGHGASTAAKNAFSIGTEARANSVNSFAIGRSAVTGYNLTDAMAIGQNAAVNASNAIVIGSTAPLANATQVNALSGIAIGTSARTNSASSIALGPDATIGYSLASPAVAIGSASVVNGSNGVALGNESSISSVANSTALGALSAVSGANSTAVGYKTTVTKSNALILGDLTNSSLSVGIGSENFSSANREKLLVDAGSASSSYNVISGKGTINSYLQLNIQNRSADVSASSDLVATADNGSETVNFVNLGINSSGYSSSGILGGANTAYLYATGNDFVMGNNTNNKSLIFYTTASNSNTERMRITANGLIPGQDNVYTAGSSTNRWSAVWSANGTIQTSDARLKKNIHPLQLGLAEVMKLEPVTYDWKDNSGNNKIGLIAQDVKKIVPQVVVGDEDTERLGMNYAELVPVLINAIKEEAKQLAAQREQIELLIKEINLLKAKK